MQALPRLKHMYSGLILPYQADDGFRIAEFVSHTLTSPDFSHVATSLFAYNNDTKEINLLRPITVERASGIKGSKAGEIKTFWCWWRDISHYELYDLLNLSFKYADEKGDIYTDFIYPKFYQMMIEKKTKQWDGKPRDKRGSSESKKSEKQNYKIPLVQLELWTRDEGRLTDLGFNALKIGKKYGPNSSKFKNMLAYSILVNGRHLDLINMIEKFQKVAAIAASSKDYVIALEAFLSDNGCIGKRKPTAVKTGAKISYLRDEMKLWNKLDLLVPHSCKSYFFPHEGYKFNWERITTVLLSPSSK